MEQDTFGVTPTDITTVAVTGPAARLKAPAVAEASVVNVWSSSTVAPAPAPAPAATASTATIAFSSHATSTAPAKCAEVRGGNKNFWFRCHRGLQHISQGLTGWHGKTSLWLPSMLLVLVLVWMTVLH